MGSTYKMATVTITCIAAILTVAVFVVMGLYVFRGKSEGFKRFNIVDGNCNKTYPSIVDFYSSKYPFYPQGGYYKPLDVPSSTVSFDQKMSTPLYSARV